MTLRTVGVRLTAEIGEYQSKMKAAGQSTRDFKGELDKAAQKGNLDKVTNQATGLGLGLAGVAVAAIKSAADFDKAMSSVAAATHAPKAEIAQLRAAALQAGKDTMYSATEAADGITELSKAGVSTADVLNGGLKGALSLAAAGQLGVGEAAETAASAMTQFGLSGSQVPHIADLLAAAAGKAQGSVHDMGYALSQSGLVANQFGLSIEDTTGALAEFASAGLIGSDAGTSLKTMLLALANPSIQTRNEMSDLGISFYDAQGKFAGLSGVAQILQTRLKDLTVEQRNQALGQIFGNDAIRAASILYTDGAAGVAKWKSAVNDAGYAAETAQKQTDNLAGDIERLKGSLETLSIEGGSGANSGLRLLTKGVNALVNGLADLPSGVSATAVVLAGLSGAVLLGAVAWTKYHKATADAKAELIAMGPAGEKAAAGVGLVGSAVTKAAGIFGIWLAAMSAADAIAGKSQTNVDALGAGLEKFGQGADLSGESARVLGKDLNNLTTGFKFLADTNNSRDQWTAKLQRGLESSIPGLKDYNSSLSNTQAQITAVDSALAGMVTAGHASDAAATFSRLASILAVNGVSLDEFKNKFPAYRAALEASGSTAKGTANQLGDLNSALKVGADVENQYKTEADSVAGALRGQAAAFVSLSHQLRADVDPAFAFVTAQEAMTKAQKDATAAVKQHGAASVQAKAANKELVTAALDLQEAAGRASATLDGKLDPALAATLKQSGLTKAQIKEVGKELEDAKKSADKYTGKYPATVTAPGATQAKKQLDDAYTAANHFAGPYVADVRVTGQGKVEAELRKLSSMQQSLKSANTIARLGGSGDGPGFAGGGWTGPGGKDQPAGVVHADEFVINKNSRQKIESRAPGLLDQMNTTGTVPGYAGGGMVWPYPVDASKTKVPTAPNAPAGPGGPGYKWMEAVVRAAFPGMPVYSDFRPGAITLTGNRSYHGFGRAVDFAPSKPLAEWINLHYMNATKELITPWQSLNIHNGSRHQYSALIENEHNFAGGNAHDHWAMANGGTIAEPIFGIGASGRTYSFGENGVKEQVIPNWRSSPGGGGSGGGVTNVNVTVNAPVGSSPREIGKQVATVLESYSKGGGRVHLRGSVTP